MQLSRVVLPAPLGPMMDRISPSWTSRLTRLTAWTPPNAFETSRISTSALILRRGPRRPPPRPPPEPIARAKPALKTPRSTVPGHLVTHDGGLGLEPPDAPRGSNRRFERRLRRRNPVRGGGIGRGAQPPSEYSRQPPLAPAVMLHVAVALPLADAGEPQVELLDVLVLADRPGVAVEDDASVLHHVAVLSEPERHRGVLLREQDSDARLAVHATDDLEDLVHQHRRQPHRGLVEQHELGPGHERAADRHHLLLAARDVAGLDLAPLRQPGKVAIHELELPLRRVAVLPRVAAREEVLLDREVLEDVPALHHLDDSTLDDLGRVLPVDRQCLELDRALRHVTALGPEQPGDRLQGRALPGAVGPEEGDDAPRGDPQRHPLQHEDHVVVDHLDVVDRQQRPGVVAHGAHARLLLLGAVALRVAGLLALLDGRRLDLRADDVAHRRNPVGHDGPFLAVPLLDEHGPVALVVLAGHLDRMREAFHAHLFEPRLGEVQVLHAPADLLAGERLVAVSRHRGADRFGGEHRVDDTAVVERLADRVLLAAALPLVVDELEEVRVDFEAGARRVERGALVTLRAVTGRDHVRLVRGPPVADEVVHLEPLGRDRK